MGHNRPLHVVMMASFSFAVAAAMHTSVTVNRAGPSAAQMAVSIRPRLARPSMHMGGSWGEFIQGPDSWDNGPDAWWTGPPRAGERSAAHRAHQRAQRFSHHQQQPRGFDGHPDEGFWVMIFNAGQHNEGVYTQTGTEQTQGPESGSVLAFEATDDAGRFAQDLHATGGFDLATPLFWSAAQLSQFCHTSGLGIWKVPRGTLPTLPSRSSDQLGGTGERSHPPERMYPGGGPPRRDPYTSYRLWLEELLLQPDTCGDDDCALR